MSLDNLRLIPVFYGTQNSSCGTIKPGNFAMFLTQTNFFLKKSFFSGMVFFSHDCAPDRGLGGFRVLLGPESPWAPRHFFCLGDRASQSPANFVSQPIYFDKKRSTAP